MKILLKAFYAYGRKNNYLEGENIDIQNFLYPHQPLSMTEILGHMYIA